MTVHNTNLSTFKHNVNWTTNNGETPHEELEYNIIRFTVIPRDTSAPTHNPHPKIHLWNNEKILLAPYYTKVLGVQMQIPRRLVEHPWYKKKEKIYVFCDLAKETNKGQS